MREKFDEIIDILNKNNSDTDKHREQHKCLWDNIKINSQNIKKLEEDLHSNNPTRRGLSYQVCDLSKVVLDIKRIMYIGVGIMLAINILPKLKQIIDLLN